MHLLVRCLKTSFLTTYSSDAFLIFLRRKDQLTMQMKEENVGNELDTKGVAGKCHCFLGA